MTNPIYDFLPKLLAEHRISDFHLHAGKTLAARIHGELKHFEGMLITEEDLDDLFGHFKRHNPLADSDTVGIVVGAG
jgi:Tfp pilus assembly pilus retraction ATPase PilT